VHDEPGNASLGDGGLEDTGLEDTGPQDMRLEEELRELARRLDPVPDRLVQAAVDAYAWRTVDAELAELVADSLADVGHAAVRGIQPERLLSFRAGGLTIEVEVTPEGPSRRLIGQLVPPQQADVEIRHQDEVVTLATDKFGRFMADSVPAGPMSLRCGPAAGLDRSPVVTEWVPI
jgi:hypothetical protein